MFVCDSRINAKDGSEVSDVKPVGDLGLIGLAVMGQNLILNMADNGFNIVAYNRTVAKVDSFVKNEAKGWLC
jgi:6-phosphogluconate dehydrogenase